MSTSLLYHCFGVREYRYLKSQFVAGEVIFTIERKPESCRCASCDCSNVIQICGAEWACWRVTSQRMMEAGKVSRPRLASVTIGHVIHSAAKEMPQSTSAQPPVLYRCHRSVTER